MRVLFLSTPLTSHVFPMITLAWALRSAGHDVLFGTTGPGLAAAAAGLPVIDFDPEGRCLPVARIDERRPDIVKAHMDGVSDGLPLLALVTREYAERMVALARWW